MGMWQYQIIQSIHDDFQCGTLTLVGAPVAQ